VAFGVDADFMYILLDDLSLRGGFAEWLMWSLMGAMLREALLRTLGQCWFVRCKWRYEEVGEDELTVIGLCYEFRCVNPCFTSIDTTPRYSVVSKMLCSEQDILVSGNKYGS